MTQALLVTLLVFSSAICTSVSGATNTNGIIDGSLTDQHKLATTAVVYIVRHGEEPKKEETQGPHLSCRGYQRADKLPEWFDKNWNKVTHGLPVAIFAAGTSETEDSLRSIETCNPYGQMYGIEVNHEHMREQVDEVALRIRNLEGAEGKSVLVCWPHKYIPALAHALGAKKAPNKWHSKVYDRVWKIQYLSNGKVDFEDLPQRLLDGDSNK